MNAVKLRLINNSNDANNSQIVIFQRNVSPTGYNELAVAWKVIENLGQGNNHPFLFPLELQIAANDSYGNYTPEMRATPGNVFHMVRDTSGDVLKYKSTGPATEVQLVNDLSRGAIDARILRDGRLLALKTSVAPGQKATFMFKPTIFIGVASQVEEGDIIDSAILTDINTELSLLGVASADIVMSGGGPGRDSTPFTFDLQNIQMA